jgi:hypothetical protein
MDVARQRSDRVREAATARAATKVLLRRLEGEREARTTAGLRAGPPGGSAIDRTEYHPSRHLPFSYAPYRLQAADRWWRELGLMSAESQRRRHGR